MALYAKVGSFTKATGPGTQDVTWSTGGNWPVDAIPKAVILFPTRAAATGWTAESVIMAAGIATAAAEDRAMSAVLRDGFNEQHRALTDANIVRIVRPNAEADGEVAGLDSFLTNGFRLDWTTITAAIGWHVLYIALAGDDIMNAKAIQWQQTATSTQTVTGVGFEGDLALHFANGQNNNGLGSSRAAFVMGVMNATGEWVMSNVRIGATAGRAFRTDRCYYIDDMSGTLVSGHNNGFNSDGFEIGWDNVPAAGDLQRINTLVLQGSFLSHIFALEKSTAGAPVTDSEPLGFPGLLAILGSAIKTAGTSTVTTGVDMAVGLYDGTSERAYTAVNPSGDNNTEGHVSQTKAVVLSDALGATTEAEADAAFDDDDLDLTWTTNDATATHIGGLALGAAPSEGAAPPDTPLRRHQPLLVR